MSEKHLDERLSLIAQMTPHCRLAADIGTDHGLLITHLVRTGKIERGIAADINPMPLQKAEREISASGLQDRIAVRLTDGLAGIAPEGLGAVILAGMGGELIAQIIGSWPHFRTPGIVWLLQPMSKPERLRGWLFGNGFAIAEERCCRAAGKLYSVLRVEYTGEEKKVEPYFFYAGAVSAQDPLGREYLSRREKELRAIAAARSAAGEQERETALLKAAADGIARLLGQELPVSLEKRPE